jgi:type III pantothenate kinase
MPLLLTIDVGNTNTVLGVHDGEELKAHWRLTTRREQTADEYGILVRSLFAASSIDVGQIVGVALASVVPPLTSVVVNLSRNYLGHEPLVIEPGVKTGMPILYDVPQEVGADRIVNAVAAYARLSGPCVVVDFGTATTFDVVTARGEYAGGVIVPGITISAEALFEKAARLWRVEIRRPERVIGKTTATSIQSGLYFGYLSLVDGLIERIARELPSPPRVIATGGLAELFGGGSERIEEVDPLLTLTGLRLIHERNRGG